MSKLIKNARRKIGQNPGSLIYTGDKSADGIRITAAGYNKSGYQETIIHSDDELNNIISKERQVWLNIDGIHDTDLIGRIGRRFNIHPLTQEDILNTSHRPKSEDLGNYIFIVLKMLGIKKDSKAIKIEQVSIILTKHYVISFQEDRIDEFHGIRESLKQNKGYARELGSDYLAYRILDTIVDNYFSVLENIGDRIEDIEEELLMTPTKDTLQKLYNLKGDLILLRRAAWPLREVISGLEKIESPIINKNTMPYLRDVYDHIIQIIDTTENYREMIAGMMDIYLSSVSNRLNEIMKVLTIISTIFIPLNFLASIYGMNFNTLISPLNMPELNWYFGYPFVLTIMLIVGITLVIFFKRKGWF